MNLYTIGVYGKTEDVFFSQLVDNDVRSVIDVRQRRGVRGSQYAFSNVKRLQVSLDELGIRYIHWKELAPTPEIRQLQHIDDTSSGTLKRQRMRLSDSFVSAYADQVLAEADRSHYIDEVEDSGPVALLCVERWASACHRRLIAKWLSAGSPRLRVVDL